VAKEAKNPELNEKVIELQQLILEIQRELIELHEQNQVLRRKLADKEQADRLTQNLVFSRGAYWLKQENEKTEGPFCQTCWDGSQKLVRLQRSRTSQFELGPGTLYLCKIEDKSFVVYQGL
jgi:uncharacterized protein YhaN